MASKYHWIDDSVKIECEDTLPKDFVELLRATEKYDLEDDLGSYINIVDAIDVRAKMMYGCGSITKKTWDMLLCRYKWW